MFDYDLTKLRLRSYAATMYGSPDTGWWDSYHIPIKEINAKYAQINLMSYISQYTKRNPSVFFGNIKQF